MRPPDGLTPLVTAEDVAAPAAASLDLPRPPYLRALADQHSDVAPEAGNSDLTISLTAKKSNCILFFNGAIHRSDEIIIIY